MEVTQARRNPFLKVLPSLPGIFWWKLMFELGGGGRRPAAWLPAGPRVRVGSICPGVQALGPPSSVTQLHAGPPEVSQLELGAGASWRVATFAAGRVDSASQPGNAWPGAWKVLETPPSMGARGSPPARTGYSQSSLDSYVFQMFTFFSGLELVLCPPETNTKHIHT